MSPSLLRRTHRTLALALLLGACAPAVRPVAHPETPMIQNTESLISALHGRYADRWYRTLSFKQAVIRSEAGSTVGEPAIWIEYAEVPGRLRIDFGNGESGDGVIFEGDSLYVFQADALVRRVAQRNPLVVLGFDMYVQPPERTLQMLREEGFDLAKFHRATWQGEEVYGVGAEPGDERSPQFWVEAERLLFVRLIQPQGADGSQVRDIRFNRYQPLGGGWIAPEVVFLVDGEEVMREDYFDMQSDVPLDPRLFDPEHWKVVRTSAR
jgi:hypothetical protein